MQSDYRSRETHDECGRTKRPEFVEIAGHNASDPKYEGHKASTLQPNCDQTARPQTSQRSLG